MKKLIVVLMTAILATSAFARGPRVGFRGAPPPPPRVHYHHHSWHGGDWAGFTLGVGLVGAVIADAVTRPAPPPPAPVVVQPVYTPVTVYSAPVVLPSGSVATTATALPNLPAQVTVITPPPPPVVAPPPPPPTVVVVPPAQPVVIQAR